MGVLAYLSTALCGARTRTEYVLIMVSDADTRQVGRMNSWWIFSGFFGYTFVVLNLVGESVYPAVLAHRSNTPPQAGWAFHATRVLYRFCADTCGYVFI